MWRRHGRPLISEAAENPWHWLQTLAGDGNRWPWGIWAVWIQQVWTWWKRSGCFLFVSHLGRFDLVSHSAAPALQIGQHFALLAIEARMHLAPPLLLHYRSCGDSGEAKGQRSKNSLTCIVHRIRSKMLQDICVVPWSKSLKSNFFIIWTETAVLCKNWYFWYWYWQCCLRSPYSCNWGKIAVGTSQLKDGLLNFV